MKITDRIFRRAHSVLPAACALLTFTLPGVATAQAPITLTLKDAQELAARHNPGYRRTTNDLSLSGIEQREAWQNLLPRPGITLLSSGMNWNLARIGTDNFGNPVENPEARMIQSANTNQSANLSMSVDLRNFVRLRNQGERIELREASAASDLNGLRASVAREFLNVQEHILTLDLNESLLEDAVKSREAVEQLYALARADRLEILTAEIDLAERENQVEQSRAALTNALLSLRNLIGDPTLSDFEVIPAPTREVDPTSLDEEALVAIALQSSPRLRQQEGALHLAGREVTISRMQWLPTMSVNMTLSRSELSRDGGDAFLSLNPNGAWDRSIRLNLSFPDLGRFFDIQGGTQRQQLAERNQAETLRELKMQVEQEVRTRVVDLRLAQRSLEIQKGRGILAEERLNLSFESYRMGGATTFEALMTALEQTAQSRRQEIQARYALERALIALEETLGVPLQLAGVRTSTGE